MMTAKIVATVHGLTSGLFSSSAAFLSDGSTHAPLRLWREMSLGGAYIPTLMLVFGACVGLTWVVDQALARLGAYHYIWHPPLFRVSLFTCLLAGTALMLFG